MTSGPALLGFGAVALYAVGVWHQVTALQGAGLNVTRTLPLLPLEDQLTRGLAIVLSPSVLFLVPMIVIMVVGIQRSEQAPLQRQRLTVVRKRDGQEAPCGRTVPLELVIAVLTSIAVFAVFAAVAPWSTTIYGTVLVITIVAVARLCFRRGVQAGRAIVLAIVVGLAAGNFVRAFVDPPLLETAVLHLDDGGTLSGAYIGARDSTVIILGNRGSGYQRIPMGEIRRVDVRPPPPKPYPSLVETLF